MVFVAAFIPVVMLGGLFLFQSGKLTSEKMQLQNAADATAFSMSTVEARDLNFLSYINRAMVANEIGIAQMNGLAAWADMWTNVPDKLRQFDATYLAAPTLGISSSIINPLTGGMEVVANPVRAAVWAVGKPVVAVLTGTNHFILNYSAQFYHLSTLFQMGALVRPLVDRNAPGAQVSDFGLLMIMTHFATYVDLVGNKVLNPFVRRYAMGGSLLRAFNFLDNFYANTTSAFASQAGGFERMAAIVRESRDPFTRGTQILDYWPARIGFRWSPLSLLSAVLPYREPDGICLELLIIEGCVNFFIQAGRFGGAELRYEEALLGKISGKLGTAWTVCQKSGACKAQNLATGEEYNWSGAELLTAGLELVAKIRVIWPFESPWTAFTLSYGFNFGTGAAQSGLRAPNNAGDLTGPNLLKGGPHLSTPGGFGINQVLNDGYFLYGNAVQAFVPWNDPVPPQGPAFTLDGLTTGVANVLGPYRGLATYHDVRTSDDGFNPYGNEYGFVAPYMVIGLIKGVNRSARQAGLDADSFVNRPGGMVEPVGRFELIDRDTQNEGADNEIAVIARSEVYFSRPMSLSQFRRDTSGDWPLSGRHPPADAEEYGSLFSPYWQARLVDTNYATRAMALFAQQGQVYVDDNRTVSVSLDADAGSLADVILNTADAPTSFGVLGNSANFQSTSARSGDIPLIHRTGTANFNTARPFINPLRPDAWENNQ